MQVPKCLIVLLLVALASIEPSQCKVKKIKAVKKLLKAKLLLKPLLKSGMFKLPMVHFVIPVQKPGSLPGLFGSGLTQQGPASTGRVPCPRPPTVQPVPLPALPGLRIPSNGCQQSGTSGGLVGASSLPMLPMLNLGSLPRLNLGGLFAGMQANSDCVQPTRPKDNCRDQVTHHHHHQAPAPWKPMRPPMAPYPTQQAPMYSPPPSSDMSMADFGNLSLDEYMNNGPQQRAPQPSYHHHQQERTPHWNADQVGFSNSGPVREHSGYDMPRHQMQQVEEIQQQQTHFDDEDESSNNSSSQEQKSDSPPKSGRPIQQSHMPY